MTSSPIRSTAAALRKAGKFLLLSVLIVAVSGGLSMVAQGLAWVHMAQDSGGLQRLGEVIFKSEPCQRCYAASRLNHESREGDEGPVPAEAMGSLRFSATLTDYRPLPPAAVTDCLKLLPVAYSDCARASLAYPPLLPPPRRAAAV